MADATTPVANAARNAAVRFLEVLGRVDFEELERCLTRDVWFRALLPRRIHESNTARDAAAAYRSWFEGAGGSRLLESDHHTMAGREYLRYRFLFRPDWAPDRWHVSEQTGFCRVKDGLISRLDVVCTGVFPADEV